MYHQNERKCCQILNFKPDTNGQPYLTIPLHQSGSVLRIRIRDPGLGAFLTPGSGIRDGRKSASGSGIRDEQPGSYFLSLETIFMLFLGLKYFDEDPGSGMETVRIRDPGWKKVGSGIRDKHPGSATLVRVSTKIFRTGCDE